MTKWVYTFGDGAAEGAAEAKNLLGGWQISGSSFFRTGTPFSVLRTNDIAGVGDGAFGQPYNLVGDPKAGANGRFSDGADNNFWFNPAAFAAPAPGTFGNHQRNSIRGPGFWKIDLAVTRLLDVGSTRNLELRIEAFNLLNHPQFAQPNGTIGNAAVGTISAMLSNPACSLCGTTERQIQIGVKAKF